MTEEAVGMIFTGRIFDSKNKRLKQNQILPSSKMATLEAMIRNR